MMGSKIKMKVKPQESPKEGEIKEGDSSVWASDFDGQVFGSKMKMKQYVYEMFDKIFNSAGGIPPAIGRGTEYFGKLLSLLSRHPDYMEKYANKPLNMFLYKQSTTGSKKIYDLVLNEDEKVPWNECITQKKKKATEKKEKVCESCGAKL